jgi:dephospho-CoA kinase
MNVFGLTGGIGMGKSAAGHILRARNVPVVDTDDLAREVVKPGQPALQELRRQFGERIIHHDGSLRRGELARIVFTDPAARHALEQILHPLIRELWRQQVNHWRAANEPVAVVIIPLLFETQSEKELDATICVACSAATQYSRLQPRGWSLEQIQQRIASQLPVEQKIARADYLVWTEGSLEVHAQQLERILAHRAGP